MIDQFLFYQQLIHTTFSMHIHTHSSICTARTHALYMYTHIHPYTHACTHTQLHTHTYVRTRTYVHVLYYYTNTEIVTHTQLLVLYLSSSGWYNVCGGLWLL